MTGWLHEERLVAVRDAIRATGARRVLDLGCGDGDLFVRLAADPHHQELVGVDLCPDALDRLRCRLRAGNVRVPRIDLRAGSLTDPAPDLAGFDCAALVETIEHIDPGRLSALEAAVFRRLRPACVVITTPNAEFNALLGVPAHRFRHPDHRFEWTRPQFSRWCRRVATAGGYEVALTDLAGCHPELGGASQMAVFTRADTLTPAKRRGTA